MPDQIPEQCAPLQSRVDSLTFQWHQLQEELEGADPSDRTRISNLVGAKERELRIAEDSLADCIANFSAPSPPPPLPPDPPPPPPDPIPEIPAVCIPYQDRVDQLTFEWHQLQDELEGADPSDRERISNLVGAKERELQFAKASLQNCIDNPPPPPPSPPPPDTIPGVPDACVPLYRNVEQLTFEWHQLQKELAGADPSDRERISNLVGAKEQELVRARTIYNNCVTPPVLDGAEPAPSISADVTLKQVQKIIPWSFLQAKVDELFNNREDQPIVSLRFHNEPVFDPPKSIATMSIIEAEVIDGQVTTEYNEKAFFDLDQLSFGYYFNDVNSDKVTINLDPLTPEPILVKIHFECSGPEEMPSVDLLIPNMDFIDFYITLKLSFDLVRFLKPIPVECNNIQANIDIMNFDMADLQREMQNPDTNHALLAEQINALSKQIQLAEDELRTCITNFGGVDSTGSGKLEFLSWIDKIGGLEDDDFDEALKQYLVVHIETTSAIDPGGIAQGEFRNKIYDKIKDPVNRAKLNDMISRWMLGGKGDYDVASLENDGQNLTINYFVPANKLDPFPDSTFMPADWPYLNNPNANPTIDFSIPSNLSNIKHIVVLTMENRSFDHMLGYLSLPVSAGGMGRTDVDGLSGTEFNPYQGINYPVFAFAPGDTAFSVDPGHSHSPVKQQINDDPNTPGSGKMDGFITALAEKYPLFDAPERIMGYHTVDNVPVFDAIARDFGISHRWFSSHPGPTFTNRFYELTGRLNLGSGLNKDFPPVPEDWWEFSNSSPLTPVFNKSIFDYLTDYHNQIERGVTWKYYEDKYCFLRFFSNYTFNNTNVVSMNDPVNGFFADAKNGTLPSVSFIDPHFIELPPDANCDGPVADIKEGQALVQKIVEAVVTSPNFPNTLLIITYDEHGGFYDHVPPPSALPYLDESLVEPERQFPIKTYGVRVPALFISPWINPGSVFGHAEDENGKTLYFDHTSILKTIARRFMSRNPPYMGVRYAAANDLTSILSPSIHKPLFLPFVKHNLIYNPNSMRLNIEGSTSSGAVVARFDTNDTDAQKFAFEQFGDHIYIRTFYGNRYLTVDVPDGNTTVPAQGFGIKQDLKYDGALALIDPVKFNLKYQLWGFTRLDATEAGKNLFTITNAFFPNVVLRTMDLLNDAVPVVLGNKATDSPNVWSVIRSN